MRSEIGNICVIALLVFLIFNTFNVHGATQSEINWTDMKTISQISNLTIPLNASYYVGALKLYNIDSSKIDSILITSYAYTLNITIVHPNLYGVLTPVGITTNFTDLVNHRSFERSIGYTFPGDSDAIYVPNYYPTLNTWMRRPTFIEWSKNDRGYLDLQEMINNPYNESTLVSVSPTKNVVITVVGTDKIDVDYMTGTLAQLSTTERSTVVPSFSSWVSGVLADIPFIGKYLDGTFIFLTVLFTIIFSTLDFLINDVDILFLMVLSFSMLHGIIVMASGGTPFDGVNHPVRDILFVFERMYKALLMFFALIWKVVQALATLIP